MSGVKVGYIIMSVPVILKLASYYSCQGSGCYYYDWGWHKRCQEKKRKYFDASIHITIIIHFHTTNTKPEKQSLATLPS